jgi:hypothetical protein
MRISEDKMSICKICEKNGYPGITIAWDNNIKTKEGRYIALEPDKVTPHKHYEPNGKGSSPTSAVVKTISPPNATVPKIESLSQINFAEVLSKVLVDYIRLKRQEVGVGK